MLCLLLSIGGIATCEAQGKSSDRAVRDDRKISVEYMSSLNGMAYCMDRGPLAFVRVGLSEIDHAATTAHEKKHIEQYTRYPTCTLFYRWYTTPVGTLETEAEAFAAGWCVAAKMGADTVSYRSWILQSLTQRYVPGTPIYEAARVFAKYAKCKE